MSAVEAITLGTQTSGEDDRTGRHVLELRSLLAQYCNGPYSPEVREFALILRIGGKMQEFDFENCERIRRSRKDKYITVDLGFPSRRWKGATDEQIRTFLIDIVETGLLCCLRRLEKDKTEVESDKLLRDFSLVKNAFKANEQKD